MVRLKKVDVKLWMILLYVLERKFSLKKKN